MKKLIAFGLTAILAVSGATVAFASASAAGPVESDAGIDFDRWGGDGGDGVYNPDPEGPQPPTPPGTEGPTFWDGLQATDLWFGDNHEILLANYTYNSVDHGERSMAGLAIVSGETSWSVSAGITMFTSSASPLPNQESLRGFELVLTADANSVRQLPSDASWTRYTTPLTANNSITIAGGTTRGFFGANFIGDLEVVGNTAHAGLATADLIWTFIREVPAS
jgi:hypothetical protein